MTREPVAISVAIGGVLSTGVALAAVFIPNLDAATQALIIAFGNSVILAGAAVFARSQVTPTSAPSLSVGTSVTTPDGGAATVTPA